MNIPPRDAIKPRKAPLKSQRMKSATKPLDIQAGRTHRGRQERLVQLKQKRLEQSNAIAQKQMQLEQRRF